MGGRGLVTTLVLGYEIAIRAGIALHASTADYHSSGAWNALGCAAVAARVLGLTKTQTLDALGTAEYHGPRSQMMRCIDHPTMVKDGSGWGALTGVSAAYLAADGFTGAPAVTMSDPAQAPLWADLGQRWRILELYFKPEPICRWAQPATEAARQLRSRHKIEPRSIASVRIETFDAAVRLGTRMPTTTEEAQYAIGFPVAVMLLQGVVGPADIACEALQRHEVKHLCQKITLVGRPDFSDRFPNERLAVVALTLRDGTILTTGETAARGDPERPLAGLEINDKFHAMAGGLHPSRREVILANVRMLCEESSGLRTSAYRNTFPCSPYLVSRAVTRLKRSSHGRTVRRVGGMLIYVRDRQVLRLQSLLPAESLLRARSSTPRRTTRQLGCLLSDWKYNAFC